MIYIGQYNTLEILRSTSVGLFLGDGDGFEVLLPNKYVPETYEIGDSIRVFLYKDGQDRPVTTTLTPKVTLNGFAFLKVSHINPYGAFMDWGLEKDLFVPYSEQIFRLEVGRTYLVHMYLDKSSARLVATTKWLKFLRKEPIELREGQAVEILVAEKGALGFTVIINNEYKGLVYDNEIFQPIRIGDRLSAYIKTIREDAKIDVCLQQHARHIARLVEHQVQQSRTGRQAQHSQHGRPCNVGIDQHHRVVEFGRNTQRKVDGREAFAFSSQSAGYHDQVAVCDH